MTDEEKVTNGRNSRGSLQLQNDLAATYANIPEVNESFITMAEEKLQDVTGNLIDSPEIERSIYQTGVVTQEPANSSTTVSGKTTDDTTKDTPTTQTDPPETATTKDTPSTSPTPVESSTAAKEATATEPVGDGEEVTQQSSQAADTSPEPGQESEPTTTAGERSAEGTTDETEYSTTEGNTGCTATPSEIDRDEAKPPGEEDAEAEADADATSTTMYPPTTEPPPRDPYQIDIPIEKKINKRTQRKLWEEIEKRKPLIPKHVAEHIQKYGKPPFELWGCKTGGKGSCYGCGG